MNRPGPAARRQLAWPRREPQERAATRRSAAGMAHPRARRRDRHER